MFPTFWDRGRKRRQVAIPRVPERLSLVALQRLVLLGDTDLHRLHLVGLEHPRQTSGVQGSATQVIPRRLSETWRRSSRDVVEMESASAITVRRSPSNRIPREASRDLATLHNSTQARRAVPGQSPPATSATASSGSHTSAGRSVTPSGIVGQASRTWSRTLSA